MTLIVIQIPRTIDWTIMKVQLPITAVTKSAIRWPDVRPSLAS
jgi:hypothetical protein